MRLDKGGGTFYFRRAASGVAASFVIVFFIFVLGGSTLFGELLLFETLPRYRYDSAAIQDSLMAILPFWNTRSAENVTVIEDGGENVTETTAVPVEVFVSPQTYPDLIGAGGVAFQARARVPGETAAANANEAESGAFYLPAFNPQAIVPYISERWRNFDYFRVHFYSIEPETDLLPRHIDFDRFFNADLSLSQADMNEPTVLIFHTHAFSEMFVDSDPGDIMTGIMGAGAHLQQALARYGIAAIHETSVFDAVNGRVQRLGAYERMEPVIRQILAENPSIQIVLDIHRDGISGDRKFLTYVDGVPTAQIMFVNGLSLHRPRREDPLRELTNLPNPYLMDNMIFSFNMQLMSNEMFPGLNRRMLLKPFRYSTHMRPKSLLVEVGNQNNTLIEAKNGMDLFARVLAQVVLPN